MTQKVDYKNNKSKAGCGQFADVQYMYIYLQAYLHSYSFQQSSLADTGNLYTIKFKLKFHHAFA